MGSAKQLPTYMKSVRKLYHENTALYKQVKSIYLGQPAQPRAIILLRSVFLTRGMALEIKRQGIQF